MLERFEHRKGHKFLAGNIRVRRRNYYASVSEWGTTGKARISQQIALQSQRHGSFRIDDNFAGSRYVDFEDGFTAEFFGVGVRPNGGSKPNCSKYRSDPAAGVSTHHTVASPLFRDVRTVTPLSMSIFQINPSWRTFMAIEHCFSLSQLDESNNKCTNSVAMQKNND